MTDIIPKNHALIPYKPFNVARVLNASQSLQTLSSAEFRDLMRDTSHKLWREGTPVLNALANQSVYARDIIHYTLAKTFSSLTAFRGFMETNQRFDVTFLKDRTLREIFLTTATILKQRHGIDCLADQPTP